MFEQFVTEILRVRGKASISKEYGWRFLMKVRTLGRLHPSELRLRQQYYAFLKCISQELGFPVTFFVRLLQYNRFDEFWRNKNEYGRTNRNNKRCY